MSTHGHHRAALEKSLGTLTRADAFRAVVELARTTADELDNLVDNPDTTREDYARLARLFLTCLTAVGLTPAAVAATTKGTPAHDPAREALHRLRAAAGPETQSTG